MSCTEKRGETEPPEHFGHSQVPQCFQMSPEFSRFKFFCVPSYFSNFPWLGEIFVL